MMPQEDEVILEVDVYIPKDVLEDIQVGLDDYRSVIVSAVKSGAFEVIRVIEPEGKEGQ